MAGRLGLAKKIHQHLMAETTIPGFRTTWDGMTQKQQQHFLELAHLAEQDVEAYQERYGKSPDPEATVEQLTAQLQDMVGEDYIVEIIRRTTPEEDAMLDGDSYFGGTIVPGDHLALRNAIQDTSGSTEAMEEIPAPNASQPSEQEEDMPLAESAEDRPTDVSFAEAEAMVRGQEKEPVDTLDSNATPVVES